MSVAWQTLKILLLLPLLFVVGIVQDEDASDGEAAISVDEVSSSARDTGAQAQGERSSGDKNQKKKFDISLPAQHLVSSSHSFSCVIM